MINTHDSQISDVIQVNNYSKRINKSTTLFNIWSLIQKLENHFNSQVKLEKTE